MPVGVSRFLPTSFGGIAPALRGGTMAMSVALLLALSACNPPDIGDPRRIPPTPRPAGNGTPTPEAGEAGGEPTAGGGSNTPPVAGMDGGGSGTGGIVVAGSGGPIPTSGSGSSGGTGGTTPDRMFNPGDALDRNDVMPGEICERLSTIQCAGEAFCCDNPGRDVAACRADLKRACDDELVDDVAENPVTAFDAEQAKTVFTELERLASQCNPSIAAFGESFDGLRSIFAGTVEAGGNCRPSSVFSMQQTTAAGLSCTDYASQACVPTLSDWTCTPHAAAGGHCFTDLNCQPGLFCPNAAANLSGADCTRRKGVGMSCEADNECESLFCRGGSCAAADVQTAYCLAAAG